MKGCKHVHVASLHAGGVVLGAGGSRGDVALIPSRTTSPAFVGRCFADPHVLLQQFQELGSVNVCVCVVWWRVRVCVFVCGEDASACTLGLKLVLLQANALTLEPKPEGRNARASVAADSGG
jgi:hypothetical protein